MGLLHLLLLGLPVLATACSPAVPDEPPPIVLIVLDTVRIDHLSCYGYSRPTSPAIDALAARADRYTNAFATAPWTLPSHASMFTGLYTFQHGAEASEKAPEWATQNALPLAPEFTTLAEVLKSEGYATAAFAANQGFLAAKFGLNQGFDVYQSQRKPALAITADAVAWLAGRPQTERAAPPFLFLNYMDAHRPYNIAPLPGGARAGLPVPPTDHPGQLLDKLVDAVLGGQEPFPEELAENVVRQYDQGVANDDFAVGRLLDELERSGLARDALIVITSDHGEYFGEHGLVEHNKDVYQTAVHVPLIVKRPRQSEGRVVAEPISLVELPYLIVESLPRELGERFLRQFPQRQGRGVRLAELYFSRPPELKASWGGRFKRKRHALFLEQWKFILSSDGANELYDLAADPRESVNLLSAKLELAAELEKRLRSFLERAASPGTSAAPVQLTPAEEAAMRQLGYLESDAPSESHK